MEKEQLDLFDDCIDDNNNINVFNNSIYIGDNFDVMSNDVFNKYKNKIKFIYIDPPYNTLTKKSYFDNINSNEWCIFIKQRISKSFDFLTDDGVIFISIDDNEYANLKNICDDIFKKENFVGTFITKQSQRSNAKHINIIHEYILCFAKNKKMLQPFKVKRINIPEDNAIISPLQNKTKKNYLTLGKELAEKILKDDIKRICQDKSITWLKNYSNIDDNGDIFFAVDLSTPSKPREVNIKEINLYLKALDTRGWISDEKFIQLSKNNRLSWKNNRPYYKLYLTESTDNCPSCLNFFSRQGTNDLKKLGINKLFDTPKPVELIKFLIRMTTKKDDIILDFFAGSGTTAQAVYELNNYENRNNKYILIQSPENIDNCSECYKKCIEYGINANMKDILLYRINTFLQKNCIKIDYDLMEINKKEVIYEK